VSADPSQIDELFAQSRAGDPAALGRLLEQYRAYLALLARLQIGRRLQGKADPSDVVQEVFLEATRGFPKFRGQTEGELLAWLRRVLATKLGGLVRRYVATRRRDVRREQDLAAELDETSRCLGGLVVAPGGSPSQEAARREQAVLLADALERLPEHYREVIVLHHMEGLSLPETARRMGRTAGGVEKLWARALARLRDTLGERP
jgi:RNA polymerase sigma-70 factor (ECF subfamily)